MNNQDREDGLTLELLSAIEENSDLTQRHLAQRMGVALGLANSYLKRCVRKGLVKIQQVPANRYLYYLTPRGFAEKSRLTGQYLSYSLGFYRRASESMAALFLRCRKAGLTRVVLCGASDLAEIASLRAGEFGIVIAGVYDPVAAATHAGAVVVSRQLAACAPFDACIITDLSDPRRRYLDVGAQAKGAPVLVPDVLGRLDARYPEADDAPVEES